MKLILPQDITMYIPALQQSHCIYFYPALSIVQRLRLFIMYHIWVYYKPILIIRRHLFTFEITI